MGFGVKEEDAVFGDDADDHDHAIKEATLKVVRVIKSATKPPNVERIAEERIRRRGESAEFERAALQKAKEAQGREL